MSQRPLADCSPSQRAPPPFELGSHHPGVHHATQEGLLTAPTLDGHARQLGIDVATTGIVYKVDGNEYSFPADVDTFIQLPVTIQLENGDNVVIENIEQVYNYRARKFQPDTGCRCIDGVHDGTRGKHCATCGNNPCIRVHRADKPAAEWKLLDGKHYPAGRQTLSTQLAIALCLNPGVKLPAWWALGRPGIRDCDCALPAGAKEDKVKVPTSGDVCFLSPLSCMYASTHAKTNGGTPVCPAGLFVVGRLSDTTKLFIEHWGVPHSHWAGLCFEHERDSCSQCASKLPPILAPAAGMDGVHGAATMERARNTAARTHGRGPDMPAQLNGVLLVASDSMARLMNNTQRVPSGRNVEILMAHTRERRNAEMGIEPVKPGEPILIKSERWADDVVRCAVSCPAITSTPHLTPILPLCSRSPPAYACSTAHCRP